MVVFFMAVPHTIEAQRQTPPINADSIVSAFMRNKISLIHKDKGLVSFVSFRKTNGYDRGDGTYAIAAFSHLTNIPNSL